MNKLIKAALERQGMTQKQLADVIHVTPQAVSKWISGESRPTQDNVVEIARALGVNLTAEMIKREKQEKTMNKNHLELEDLNSFEKASDEAKLILGRAGIPQNYPHHINELLFRLISATIGLTYHQLITYKSHDELDDAPDYSSIAANLDDFFHEYHGRENFHNELHYSFFCLGGDLFESFGKYKMPDHDYASAAMDCWYSLEKVSNPNWHSLLMDEFKIALLEIIDTIR